MNLSSFHSHFGYRRLINLFDWFDVFWTEYAGGVNFLVPEGEGPFPSSDFECITLTSLQTNREAKMSFKTSFQLWISLCSLHRYRKICRKLNAFISADEGLRYSFRFLICKHQLLIETKKMKMSYNFIGARIQII